MDTDLATDVRRRPPSQTVAVPDRPRVYTGTLTTTDAYDVDALRTQLDRAGAGEFILDTARDGRVRFVVDRRRGDVDRREPDGSRAGHDGNLAAASDTLVEQLLEAGVHADAGGPVTDVTLDGYLADAPQRIDEWRERRSTRT